MSIARVGLMAKSMVGSLLPIALVLALSVTCYMSVMELESAVTFSKRSGSIVTNVTAALTNGLEARSALRSYVSSGEDTALRQYNISSDRALVRISQARDAARNKPTMEMLDAAAGEFRNWRTNVADSTAARRERVVAQKGGESGSSAELTRHFEAFKRTTGDVVTREQSSLQALHASALHNAGLTRKAIFILALAVIVAAFTKNYYMTRKTARPLLAAVDLAEAIGRGELNHSRIEVKRNDEIGRLGAALNEMSENLKRQALAIREGVSVSLKSEERISSAVSHLTSSTSRTAAALTEATATVEQIIQAANVSSLKAKNVAAASQEAVRISETGLKAADDSTGKIHLIEEQMEAVGETVLKLSENARAIEDVAAVVRDLADQSNLLAVNASIEAARAGAQGKGFGVVAHEIQILSDGSKEAVENVRTILDEVRNSISAVVMATEEGKRSVAASVAQSSAAGNSIRELADRVVASSQAATVIEVTSEQQFAAMDQVATAMLDIQRAVNENLEGSSQLEAAVQELNQLGANLKEILRRFKV